MENITGENISQIISQEEYLLFYFTAKWCGPCQKIKPMILKLKEGLQTDKIKFYMIDIDENNELCEKCNVTSVPTFLLFRKRSLITKTSGANINNIINMVNNFCK